MSSLVRRRSASQFDDSRLPVTLRVRHYGFGWWDAPFWFLGPERGMSRDESNLKRRVKVWRDLGGGELADCQEFHRRIAEKRWHSDSPTLQQTWGKLLLSLMAFKGCSTARENLLINTAQESIRSANHTARPSFRLERSFCTDVANGI